MTNEQFTGKMPEPHVHGMTEVVFKSAAHRNRITAMVGLLHDHRDKMDERGSAMALAFNDPTSFRTGASDAFLLCKGCISAAIFHCEEVATVLKDMLALEGASPSG